MRVLIRLLAGAALVLLALIVLVLIGIRNETASAWLARQAASAVPEELRLENLSGDLLTGLRVGMLRYQSRSVLAEATEVIVVLRWADLLDRRLTVRRLGAATARVEALPGDDEPAELELPEIDLPVAVQLDEASVGRLEIATNDISEVIENLRLSVALADSALHVDFVEAVARGFRVELSGDLKLKGNFPLTAALAWQQLDGPLSGAGDLTGDLNELAFSHELRLPDTITAKGTVRELTSAPQLALDATWGRVAWRLEDVGEVISRNGRIALDGGFADYRLEMNLDLQAPELPGAGIELVAHGREMQVDVDVLRIVSAAGEFTGNGTIDLDGPAIAMRVTGSGLDPSYLRADLRGKLNFEADVKGDLPDRVLVQVESLDGELLGQPVAGSGDVSVVGERVELRQAKIRSGENRVSFDGAVRPALSGDFAIDAPALDLLWPGLGGRIAGDGSVSGTLEAPLVSVRLQGDDLVFEQQAVNSLRLAGEIDAAGRLNWTLKAEGLSSGETRFGNLSGRATGELSAHRIDLAISDGPFDLALESAGGWDGTTLRHTVGAGRVEAGAAGSWILRGPVDLSFAASGSAVAGHCWEGSLGLLCIEPSTFTAGRVSTAARLTGFSLAALAPLTGEGIEIEGSADAYLTIEREADALNANLNWEQSETTIRYRESEETTIESRLTEVRALITVTESIATVEAALRGDAGLEIDAVGSLAEPMDDDGELDIGLTVRVPELRESAPFLTRVAPIGSVGGGLAGDLRITGTRKTPLLDGRARLTNFPLDAFATLAGEGIEIFGTADADLIFEHDGAGPSVRLAWTQKDTRIVYRESERSVIESSFGEVRVTVDANEALANLEARVRGDYGLAVDAAGTLSRPMTDAGEFDVRLTMRVPELAESAPLLTSFVPLRSVGGALQGDLRITGTRNLPAVEGEARLTNGFAAVPQAGIEVKDIDLAIIGRDGKPLAISGSARSGEGRLDVTGELQWSEAAGAFADLTVTGQDFQVIRFPDQTVQISPDIRARVDEQRVAVSGRIDVPSARIIVEALPETASQRSSDVVVHESAEAGSGEQPLPYRLFGDLEVSLGKDVYFGGFGIDTRLAGGLKLSRPPGAEAAGAEGALRTVDGKFAAYGKELTIERGALIFAGPIDDPTVDARATRIIRYQGAEITAGVLLSGPLSNMQTRLFSEPSMSEADALSFLILDRPVRRAEGDDAELISGAAVAMGLAQALPITQSLQESTGLDEVGFEKSEDDDTAVVAGKRLSEDVYVRYTYGLFNRIGTFFVRYRIGGGFEIEAGSGQEQTLDLIFSIDR